MSHFRPIDRATPYLLPPSVEGQASGTADARPEQQGPGESHRPGLAHHVRAGRGL